METITAHSAYYDDLVLALQIADEVDAFTMRRFMASDLHVETKPDLSPVTDADREAENIARRILHQERPYDAIVGEEHGHTGHSARTWIIDPIDGTKNFVRGVPVWATLIALSENERIVLGVVSAPALSRRWFAAENMGAYCGERIGQARAISVSGVQHIADASLSYSSLDGWEPRNQLPAFIELCRQCWRTRGFGDFWSYMLVAEGVCDIATEPKLELHDMAALVPIVTEAGGRFTSLSGIDGAGGPGALATNGILHEAARAILNTPTQSPE
ncbi:inositol monophosphatase family protein [Trueperella sp. LYQ143]|uniref:inositol monophosphatase family protein n=1 Tax=Trueperella sp. LYQ143 TaxID=3391059 RepID=UPI00398352F1